MSGASWLVMLAVLGQYPLASEQTTTVPFAREDQQRIDYPAVPPSSPILPGGGETTAPVAVMPLSDELASWANVTSAPQMTSDESAVWSTTAAWIGDLGETGLGVVDFVVSRTTAKCWLGADEPVQITPMFGVHYLPGIDSLGLAEVMFDASLSLSWTFWAHERGGMQVGVTPGLYGDMKSITGETFQVTGWITGDWQIGDRWTVVGGVAVVRQLKSSWLPVGGLVWIPSDDWQCEIVVPRPRVAYRWRQTEVSDSWIYVAGQFGGGSWSVQESSGDTVLLTYSDLRAMVGVNHWQLSGKEFTAEFGYVFSRSLTVDQESVSEPANTWMVQLTCLF